MAKTNKVYYKNKHGDFIPYYSKQLRFKIKEELEHIRELYKPFYFTPYESEPYFTIDSVRKNFRLYPKHKHYGVYTSSEESATHKYCIREICKLNTLKIKLKNSIPNYTKGSIINFEFNYALPEFEITMGEKTVVRPDIVLFLRVPADLAIYFKRIVFVEIVVTHNIDEKIRIYDKARVPVLRIKANPKWGKKSEFEMSQTKKEELQTWIRNSFKQTYSADLLLPKEHQIILENEVVEKAEAEKKLLKQELDNALNVNQKFKNEISRTSHIVYKLEARIKDEISKRELLEDKNILLTNDIGKAKKRVGLLVKLVLFFAVITTVLILTNRYIIQS